MSAGAAGTGGAADRAAWLADLERAVHRAVERLAELGEDNARLSRRVAELEERLAAAADPSAGDAADAEAWRGERQEVRARVERLARHLESLLDGD